MSNEVRRGPMHGLILKNGKPVGAIDLPDPCESFIAEFNQRYSHAGLVVKRTDSDISQWATAVTTDCISPLGEAAV